MGRHHRLVLPLESRGWLTRGLPIANRCFNGLDLEATMTAIVRALSRAFSATNEESDSALPFLMFTVVGLLLTISLVLAFDEPSPVGFENF